MANVTKADLIAQVAAQAGTDKTTAAAVLKAFEETVAVTIKKGEWTVIHDGGDINTQWSQLVYNTEKEGKIPAGTSISFQMRAADVKGDLEATPWIGVVDGVPDQFPTGRFVEIRARLLITEDDLEESPVLSDVCVIKEGE